MEVEGGLTSGFAFCSRTWVYFYYWNILKGVVPGMTQAFLDIINVPRIHFPGDWKKENIVHLFKKGGREGPRNYTPVSFTSLPGKVMEQMILLQAILKGQGARVVVWDSQHGFTRGKSCLTNPINFCDGVTVMVWTRKGLQVPFIWISGPFQAKPFFDFEIALNLELL